MIKKVLVSVFFILICAQLFAQQEVLVVISYKLYSRGGASYGAEFGLVNLDSGEVFFSKRLSIFNQSHSVFEKIPAGKYRVFYFAGEPAYQTANETYQAFFGIIDLEPNKNYYLGNFIGRKNFDKEAPIVYTIDDDQASEKLMRVLRRKNLIGSDEDLVKLFPYHSDSLVIE